MTGDHSGEEFDDSERKRVRLATEIVLGNGRPGLTNRVQRIELCGYGLLVAAFALFVQGIVSVHPPVLPAVYQNATGGPPATAAPPKPVLTTEEVADEIGVNADTVRRRDSEGRLDGFRKIGENRWARIVPEIGPKDARIVHDGN